MYTTTTEFKALMAEKSRTLTSRGLITFPDATTQALTAAQIVSVNINEDAGSHIPIGGVSASTITLKLDNRLGEWNPSGSILGSKTLDGATLKIEVGVHNGTAFVYSNLGVYMLEGTLGQEQETTITIKGADYLANKALAPFVDDLTYSKTVKQILDKACLIAGITLKTTTFTNSDVSIPIKPLWESGTTCRAVIGYIACLACGIARIDRDGKLEIVAFKSTSDYTINTSRYKKFERQGAIFGGLNAILIDEYKAPDNYGSTRVAVDVNLQDNELNSIGIGGNPLLVYGGARLATLSSNMLSALSGLSFDGGSFTWQGDPSLTVGDVVTITDLAAGSYNLLVTKQTLELSGGFEMTGGNQLNSNTVGKAKDVKMKIFTPTGGINAAALQGDINIRAGNQLNLLSDATMKIQAGGNLDILSGGTITIASDDSLVVGADTLADYVANMASGGSTIWYQTDTPTSALDGDIWYDTDAIPVTIKRLESGAWVDITSVALSQALKKAGDAQAAADGKIVCFAQAGVPISTAIGDLWVKTNDNNKLYRAERIGANSISFGNWVLYQVASGYVKTSKITVDDNKVEIESGGNINLKSGGTFTVASDNFKVDSAGNVTLTGKVVATSGEFSGKVTSTSGEIGGFTISDSKLSSSTLSMDTANSWFDVWGMKLKWNESEYCYMVQCGSYNLWLNGATIILDGDLAIAGDISYGSEAYKGKNALTDISRIKNGKDGKIDHSTFPDEVRGKTKYMTGTKKGQPKETISAVVMIDLLTKGIQELSGQVTALTQRIETLENTKAEVLK